MRITTFGRGAALLSILSVGAFGGAGCGGGGGGGGSPTPVIPGVLAALAVEGGSAPGTGPGVYGAFTTSAMIAVANGGWTAFVADVVGGSTTKALFVAEPDGTVVLAYAKGDLLPDSSPGSGVIVDFERIFVTSSGVVVAVVTGTAPAEGIVTARIDVPTDTAVEKDGAFYLGEVLPFSLANPGTLTNIDQTLVAVDDQGSIFFRGVGSGMTPINGIYFCDRSGANRVAVVAGNDPVGAPITGIIGNNFDGLGIDADGIIVAYSVNIVGGVGTDKGLFVTDSNLQTEIVAVNNSLPPNVGARALLDVHPAGTPLLVSSGGGAAFLSWTGKLAGGSPDLGVFTRQVGPALGANLQTILACGDSAANASGVGAIFADVTLVPCQQDPNRITLQALVSGGNTDRIYWSSGGVSNFLEIFREGTTAPGGANFANTYPSFATPFTSSTDVLGSPAFTATLTDATTGVFWAIIGNGFYKVAKQGDSAPGTGGGSFLPFGTPAVVTTATNVCVFRGAVTGGTPGAASGIFRQG